MTIDNTNGMLSLIKYIVQKGCLAPITITHFSTVSYKNTETKQNIAICKTNAFCFILPKQATDIHHLINLAVTTQNNALLASNHCTTDTVPTPPKLLRCVFGSVLCPSSSCPAVTSRLPTINKCNLCVMNDKCIRKQRQLKWV